MGEDNNLSYMQLEEEERETHIYIPYKSKGEVMLETTDRFMMMKIDNLIKKDNSKWRLEEVQTALVTKDDGTKERQIVGKVYKAPVECVYLRVGKKQISEEAKQKYIETLNNNRK